MDLLLQGLVTELPATIIGIGLAARVPALVRRWRRPPDGGPGRSAAEQPEGPGGN
ncbi:hypothetical protein [Kitasatospora sp. NPDC057223]|uniref:hypothetical protein n=1 Tax=Kitasatospora sp. NPDC057223 TaxID=3346055 RepID=UPI00364545AC